MGQRWRIIENEFNLRSAPWSDAVGIEEADDTLAVPGIICWFTRGWPAQQAAEQTVALHNIEVARGKSSLGDLVERTAMAMALGNNGGDWAEHYTAEHKQLWRGRAILMVEDVARWLRADTPSERK